MTTSFRDGRRDRERVRGRVRLYHRTNLLTNLLNQNAKTIINTNAGPLFGSPIAILPPLVARLGLRFVF